MSTTDTCGAKLRRKQAHCKQKAGARTDHPGEGRCWLHGGLTPRKHGLYSTVQSERFNELYEFHLLNPDPLNLLPEVAKLRAYAQELMERWESVYGVDGALLAWHESFKLDPGAPGKPRQLPDFSAVSTVVDRVGAMVDRIHRHQSQGAISLATLNRLLDEHGTAAVAAVRESGIDASVADNILDDIDRRWGAITAAATAAPDARAKRTA